MCKVCTLSDWWYYKNVNYDARGKLKGCYLLSTFLISNFPFYGFKRVINSLFVCVWVNFLWLEAQQTYCRVCIRSIRILIIIEVECLGASIDLPVVSI